ncbi:MAG: AMP-binding protein [Lachnospiraceae bacterium]|nr:AMP-binding protein [Lachnospiraceae bacterium]
MMENGYQASMRISIANLHVGELRLKQNKTRSELAEAAGISEELLQQIEERRIYPPDHVLYLLAEQLGVTYEQIRGIEPTGYPSLDQPWMRYYREEAFCEPLPVGSIFYQVWNNNRNRGEEPAIEYKGTKVSYKEMFSYIERARDSFLRMGVQAGDIVTMALPNIPENVYCLYALNRIGAVANMVDLRLCGEKLVHAITSVHSRIVVCSDVFAEHIAEIQNQVQVDHWIMLSPYDSTPKLVQGFLKWKNRKPEADTIANKLTWGEFLKLGAGYHGADYPGRAEDSACIFHTSGTTALPKAVMLTNGNMNALAFAYKYAPLESGAGDRFLSHIPPFLAYNTVLTIHMPLFLGMTVLVIPICPIEDFGKLLISKKPNHVGGSAAFWREFVKDPAVRTADFSGLRGLASGNDSLSIETMGEANEILKQGGCTYPIIEGYGMTEASSAAITNWPTIHPEGSIGIPLCVNNAAIFDMQDPEKELTYGELGEICIQGPTVMKGYYGDPETTGEVLKLHKDGGLWLHSGDLGMVDEQGCFWFKGRMKRTIVTYEGFKLAPLELERLISRVENVEVCCVVGHPNPETDAGQVPAVFLVLKDRETEEQTIAEVKQLIEESMDHFYHPYSYTVLEQLPLTPNGKVDYRSLEG